MRFDGRTLYVATTNAGKLRDFAAAGLAFDLPIEALAIVKNLPEPVEDGATFEANARIKAEYYSRHAPGLWVLADDSGLEVDALDGAPGVRSARFAADEGYASEPGMTVDERNNACLLEKLKLLSEAGTNFKRADESNEEARDLAREIVKVASKPTARYRCSLALAFAGEVQFKSEGTIEGEIITVRRGTGGFGYDPVFWLSDLRETMAEIEESTRQQFSHRGKALLELLYRVAKNPHKGPMATG